VREYFGDGDECHMAYHFPLMPRIYMAIAQEDRYPITEIMQQTPGHSRQLPVGDLPAQSRRTDARNGDQQRARLHVHDLCRRRACAHQSRHPPALAPLMENDHDRIKLMNSLLLSMPGSPILYYGDEIGMGDNVFIGDRNGVRTPMQWSPDRNAGFSRADPQRSICRRSWIRSTAIRRSMSKRNAAIRVRS
jgi:maltose alpha-D-glucosyltransferase/alpha-amylase